MPESEPYISVVVTARNDDHGGDLLRRMQAFVNGWIGQCRRHGLSSELLVVDWNPPEDRPPLIQALNWPRATDPCQVRFIQVPPDVHRRYQHAEALPLYQMIAKNVGIRRARGRFVLVTNIDILFSDELIRFLADRRLDPGRMYRIDRHDIMSDVPVDASVEEQLAYCESHLIRVNAREGTFPLAADGQRVAAGEDIAARDSGIHFGNGWYAAEAGSPGEVFRWVNQDAEVTVHLPAAPPPALVFDVEPGPGVGRHPFLLQVVDNAGTVLAETWIHRRSDLHLQLPAGTEPVKRFLLRAVGGGLPIAEDLRILNFRVYRCAWDTELGAASGSGVAGSVVPESAQAEAMLTAQPQSPSAQAATLWARCKDVLRVIAEADPDRPLLLPVPGAIRSLVQAYGNRGIRGIGYRIFRERRIQLLAKQTLTGDIFQPGSGLSAGQGWYEVERFRGETFRWIRNDAELIVSCPDGPPRLLEIYIEPGPGVDWKPFQLSIRDAMDRQIAAASVKRPQRLEIAVPWQPGRTRILNFHVEGGDKPCPTDPRLLNFRLFWCGWSALSDPQVAPPLENDPGIPIESGLALGAGWKRSVDEAGHGCLIGAGAAEIVLRSEEGSVPRALRLDIAIDAPGLLPLEVQDEFGNAVARAHSRGRRICHLCLPVAPGRTGVFSLHVPDVPIRVYGFGWSDAPVDITELALGLKLLSGWSPLSFQGVEVDRLIEHSAELELTVPQGPRPSLEFDWAAAQPQTVLASILDSRGDTLGSLPVGERQTVRIDIPPAPGHRELLRIVAPGVKVYACRWSLAGKEFGAPALRAQCEGEMASLGRDIVAPDSILSLAGGWYAPEHSETGIYRWASNFSELSIAGNTGPVSLTIDIEGGPSLETPDFTFRLLDETWTCVFEAPVSGRCTLRPVLPLVPDGTKVFRVSVTGGGLPLAHDPRILDFRVFNLQAEYASEPARAEPQWAARVAGVGAAGRPRVLPRHSPDETGPIHLHTNACGDFTLIVREHWLDLRGYPEFDMYSFHIDSILCYTAHHAGIREAMLREPMRIYHIEHGLGSGWTPEGQARLFERLRTKRIPYIEYQELVGWAVQMRKLNCPIIFNRENWGLGELDLPETRLPVEELQSHATP